MLNLETARQWYPAYDAVHGFDHIERVYGLCKQIGEKEGADMEILLSAALLHDSQGSHPQKGERNNHHIRSAEFAEEVLAAEGWPDERIQAVQHCIRAHRFRRGMEAPETIEAKVLFDSDKLDVIGAVGVVRVLAFAFQVQQPAFSEPSQSFMKDWTEEEGESHSAYHEYLYKLQNISSLLFTDTARRIAEHRQQFLNAYFEELAGEMRGEL
jgi:uncharacterized protein